MRTPDDEGATLLDRLRRETRPEHDAIEAVVESLRPFADHGRYRSFLSRALGFYAAVEPILMEAAVLEPDRAKLPALVDDLRTLGATDEEIAVLPRAGWRCGPSQAAAFGCAYVLEGATLGGRVLVTRARTELGLEPRRGARFLAGYGDATLARWKSFRASLQARVEPLQGDELVASARETFQAYAAWLR